MNEILLSEDSPIDLSSEMRANFVQWLMQKVDSPQRLKETKRSITSFASFGISSIFFGHDPQLVEMLQGLHLRLVAGAAVVTYLSRPDVPPSFRIGDDIVLSIVNTVSAAVHSLSVLADVFGPKLKRQSTFKGKHDGVAKDNTEAIDVDAVGVNGSKERASSGYWSVPQAVNFTEEQRKEGKYANKVFCAEIVRIYLLS